MFRNGSRFVGMAFLAVALTGCIGTSTTEESGAGVRRQRVCGGWLGDTCRRNEYCAYPEDAMCGAADQTGVCTRRPQACIELYDPVCGCDGETHGNSCLAASAGVSVAYAGECEPDPDEIFCGGIAGLPCPDGMTCELDGDYPDAGGHCVPADPEPIFCGGIAGLPCPDGMTCQLDGDYPDAGGHCVADPAPLCGDVHCAAGESCVNCWGGPICLPPGTYCAF